MAKPATVIVHWPGQSVAACDEHRAALNRVAVAMGMPEPTATPIVDECDCVNCLNEERKESG